MKKKSEFVVFLFKLVYNSSERAQSDQTYFISTCKTMTAEIN